MDAGTIIVLILAAVALVLIVAACRLLIVNARKGYELGIGPESLFTHLWLVAGAMTGGALMMRVNGGWWLPVAGVLLFYLLSLPARSLIRMLYLGVDVPIDDFVRHKRFAEFSRRADERKP